MNKEQMKREIVRFLTVKLKDLPWRKRILYFLAFLLFLNAQLYIIYYLGMRSPSIRSLVLITIHLSLLTALTLIVIRERVKLEQLERVKNESL